MSCWEIPISKGTEGAQGKRCLAKRESIWSAPPTGIDDMGNGDGFAIIISGSGGV